jgi:hypothetical protein
VLPLHHPSSLVCERSSNSLFNTREGSNELEGFVDGKCYVKNEGFVEIEVFIDDFAKDEGFVEGEGASEKRLQSLQSTNQR